MRCRLVPLVAAVLTGLAVCTGCFLRTETITIGRDGAVTMEVKFEGSAEEHETFDALPTRQSGWEVLESFRMEEGEKKYTVESSRRFGPDEELPSGYAAAADPDADLVLEFPTSVRVEERRDGRYFFFRRVYAPRKWAYIQHWQDVFFDSDMKRLGEKPVEELTREQRRKIIQAFGSVEAHKQLEFARAALAEIHLNVPIEHRLMARESLLHVYRGCGFLAGDHSAKGSGEELLAPVGPSADGTSDYLDRLIERCDSQDDVGDCYDTEATRLLDEARGAFVLSLRDEARLGGVGLAHFTEAYQRAERYHAITEQVGAHQFEITVSVPGTIIAHNADEIEAGADEGAGQSAATWRFDGSAFRDRPHELVVVSRLTPAEEASLGSAVHGDDR